MISTSTVKRYHEANVEHGLPLATRDRRALGTYRRLGVDVEVAQLLSNPGSPRAALLAVELIRRPR